MAELRRVDPKTLVPNPNNPRSSIGSLEELRKLALNIKAIGILHPPAVRELEDGRLMIVAGHRRTEGAIYAGLSEIDVYVGDQSEDLDALAAVSENFVRLDMTEPEQWNSVTRLREQLGYTDPQVCAALMVTPSYLKRLSLLAKLHPPILDAIALGRGPDERQRKIIAQASLDEQRSAWAEMFSESVEDDEDPAEYRVKAEDPEDTVAWGALARNLEQKEWYARNARFGDDLARKHNIVWMEDLFAEPGADSRYTLDATAYAAAQQDWLDNERPESSIVLTTDEYGYIRAPEGFITIGTWMATQEGEVMGYGLNPRTLKIVEERCRPSVAFTQSHVTGPAEPEAPKERPDVSGTGHKMIGEIRTVALREALGEVAETADPWELIAALLLALEAENVRVHGDASGNNWSEPTARTLAMADLFPEGDLVRDEKLIRRHTVTVLQSILNCEVSMHSGSGLPVFIVTLSERQLLSDRVNFHVEAETAEAAGQLVLDATADEPNESGLRPVRLPDGQKTVLEPGDVDGNEVSVSVRPVDQPDAVATQIGACWHLDLSAPEARRLLPVLTGAVVDEDDSVTRALCARLARQVANLAQ
ncbi:ParB/RepB/Spo0J family partition protein [Acetobacter cerevisiae]|uniref:ParB/RepB/Spo0J family partition protein n=1 Tax=Acetobacter cerevisiae TaxID=178900 RepID=UPI000A97DF92|nr:ParB/RepB/Spo0J family partition protein [Acetobacter cerevisiae]